MVSKRTWDKLSSDEQKVITDAAAETKIYQRQISRELNEKELESLKAKGMQVNNLPPEELARIREKLRPVVAKHAPQFGEQVVNELNGELAKLRAQSISPKP